MNDARSEARKTTAAATSSIRPGRLNSMCGRLFARNCACASCGVTPRPLATVAIISANWGRHDERPRHRAHKNAAFRTRWKLNLSNEDRGHHDTLQPVREGSLALGGLIFEACHSKMANTESFLNYSTAGTVLMATRTISFDSHC